MRPTPVLRSLLGLMSLVAMTVALVLVPSTAANAAGEEGDFASRLNASRSAAGLAPLQVLGELATIARAHSERMGRENRLYHNPSLTTQVQNWQSVGENVGYGGSVERIHDALYASTGHRANMLSSTYTEMGIGTWTSPTGRLWVTQVFRQPVVPTQSAPTQSAPPGFPISPALAPTVSAFSGVLGAAVSPEFAVPGGIEQDFRGGDVLWGSATGARVVQGAIRDRYRAMTGPHSPLGLPATHELATPDRFGRYNHFQGGSIYWSPASGAREIRGAIRDTWSRLGWEHSALAYPVTDELGTPNGRGRYNHFQGGSVYWTPATGAREVRGAIRDTWSRLGWEGGPLGFPTTDELGTPDRFGRYNHFQGSSVYWTPVTGAHEVRGVIRNLWASTGWENGALGYPTSGEYSVPGGRRSDFQRGSIFWNAQTGQARIL